MDPSRSSIGAHGTGSRLPVLPEATTEDRNVHGMIVHFEVYRSCLVEPSRRIPPGHAENSCCRGNPDATGIELLGKTKKRPAWCRTLRIALNMRGLVSATQTQALDELAVALDLDALQVLEHPAALADEEQQATT